MDGWPRRSHNPPPPLNIVSNTNVEIMMGAHEWNTKPKLCLIIGAEEVARYQFVCRTTFTIGDRTFLTDGVSEEQHLVTINEIIGDDEIKCPRRFLEELFNQDKMVVIFRFALEVEKARNSLDLNLGVVDGNGDHIVPDISNVNEHTNMSRGAIFSQIGSEYVGYQPSDIAIGGPEAKPRTQALPVFPGSPSLPSSAVTNLPSVGFDGNISGATVGHGGGVSTTVLQDIAGEEENNAKRGEKGNTDGPGGDH
ncbi:hypothetical protein Bca4012_048386 [Brassica carinata]